MAELANVHLGDMLREEFIAPMGLSLRNVADAIGLLHDDLTSLIEGRRPVDADIASPAEPVFWHVSSVLVGVAGGLRH